MTRDEAVAAIHSSYRPAGRDGHKRIRCLLELLGNPQDTLRFVHITGTNGKGSTAAMLDSILCAAGYCTGRFVSPYLERFEERITVNGEQIPEAALVSCLRTVQSAVPELERRGHTPPSEFETVFAIALLHYQKEQCDIVVLEAGIGGSRDITNLIQTPEAAVITSVSLDHTKQLGATLAEIAKDKAGIIKQGGRAVVYPVQELEAANVIELHAFGQKAELIVPDPSQLEVTYASLEGNAFTYRGEFYELPLAGMHQPLNAVTVLETVEVLRNRGFDLPYQAVRAGLDGVRFPGRLELVGEAPIRVVDGGHNPGGMEALSRAVEQLLRPEVDRLIVVFGMMADKAWQPCLQTAAQMADVLILTTPTDQRALDPEEAKRCSSCPDTRVEKDPRAALAQARRLAGEQDGILVCGSIYLAGELRGPLAQGETASDV